MSLTGIGEVADAVNTIGQIINKFIPDPAERAKAEASLASLQTSINAVEANSDNVFVAGWRPFIGWVCGVGCAYSFIAQPFLTWLSVALGGKPFISLDIGALIALLSGMLGLAGMRSYEKTKK